MVRRIIEIDEERCNGCGLCAEACHEGAIGMVEGKARLLRDDYCDGLGDCLPACPVDAIHFVEREAEAFDAQAVAAHMEQKAALHSAPAHDAGGDEGRAHHPQGTTHHSHAPGGGCPGAMAHAIQRQNGGHSCPPDTAPAASEPVQSQLAQWPVQIKLVPVNAPYFKGAKLLIAADCAAYTYANFHNEFMKDRVTLIGCPKLDGVDYAEKLAEILRNNDIKSAAVVRMEVPCCGGIQDAFARALAGSGKMIPWQVYTLTTDGKLLQD